jgi:hypothetical protein
VFVHVLQEQVHKAFRGFFFKHYRLCQKAVAGAVSRGSLLSFFGDGAAGARSICF